jgi:hypothetical protein
MLTNSIILRYNAMVNEAQWGIEKKFNPSEKHELIHVYKGFGVASSKVLWFFDGPTHQPYFCRLFRDAIEDDKLKYLNEVEAFRLLDVLEKHLTTTEFLALRN